MARSELANLRAIQTVFEGLMGFVTNRVTVFHFSGSPPENGFRRRNRKRDRRYFARLNSGGC